MKGTTQWQKATASNDQGDCVEVRRAPDGMIEVRDTKDRAACTQRYTPQEWAAWLDGAKKGEFDHLV